MTVEEMIQAHLIMLEAATEAFFETTGEPSQYFLALRNRVADLLTRLRIGSIAIEYAEIELNKSISEWDRWCAEQRCKFREENPDFTE